MWKIFEGRAQREPPEQGMTFIHFPFFLLYVLIGSTALEWDGLKNKTKLIAVVFKKKKTYGKKNMQTKVAVKSWAHNEYLASQISFLAKADVKF